MFLARGRDLEVLDECGVGLVAFRAFHVADHVLQQQTQHDRQFAQLAAEQSGQIDMAIRLAVDAQAGFRGEVSVFHDCIFAFQ